MSLLNQIVDGCLWSTDKLMREREFYSPSAAGPPVHEAFARWTQRISLTSELDSARELAGLSHAELAELEAEFLRCPMRQQSPAVRRAVLSGVALVATAGIGLVVLALTPLGDAATRTLQAASAACLLAGLIPLGVGLISAFSVLHLDLSHGTTGLLVGTLNDQHPWLYQATSLTRHAVAEDYRQRTLLQRGPLRGADYVLMRELVRAQEALERVRPARSVADALQLLPVEAQALVQEPRLVRVGARTTAS
jgi:hypothetical protein